MSSSQRWRKMKISVLVMLLLHTVLAAMAARCQHGQNCSYHQTSTDGNFSQSVEDGTPGPDPGAVLLPGPDPEEGEMRTSSVSAARTTLRPTHVRPLPPVAHAGGSYSLTLPNNSVILRGSVSDGNQSQVWFLWTRDSQSPAAGDVLYGSHLHPSLYLANLVEGTYLFRLKVSDAQGRSSSSAATVEVRPDPGGADQIELELQVCVNQVSVAQRETMVRQLAALLHVLDTDIHVRSLQGHSDLSTVLRLSVLPPSSALPAPRLVFLLRKRLLSDRSHFLLFTVLRVDTVFCLLGCSGRGQCDPITKQCSCDPFWTQNPIRRYLGDGESNCEWRVLYVVLSSFLLVVCILSLGWVSVCRRKRRTKGRRKTNYSILDNMEDQERLELRPKFTIKHRSTENNSCLMMSESELDSEQDSVRSRPRCSGIAFS